MKQSPPIRFILAQIRVVAGDPERNFARMLEVARSFAGTGAIVAFPEMCVGGYLVGDLWYDDDYCDWLESFNEPLRQASGDLGLTLIYGNVYREKSGKCGKDGRSRKYNAATVTDHGRAPDGCGFFPPGIQPKTLLPNYRFFDDARYFFPAIDAAADAGVPVEQIITPFTLANGLRVGLQLCEDLWCQDYRYQGEALNTARFLTGKGAQVIVNLSASPWTRGKNGARDRRIRFVTDECPEKVPFLYVNRVGAENCGDNVIVYDGGSTVYDEEGAPVLLGNNRFEEEIITVEGALDESEGRFRLGLRYRVERVSEPLVVQKFRALTTGLRHVEQINGNPHQKFLIGISGGVDSAVVACLLERTFGADRVTGVTMPSRHTSAATLSNARHVAKALGIKLLTVPIEESVEAWRRTVDELNLKCENPAATALAMENEQARIRGSVVLSGLAARLGAVYTNNGNKLETALGYATLYGDVNGAIAPIGDLTKMEVVALARYLNEAIYGREVVPSNLLPDDHWIFSKDGVQPTAELRDNQVDPMKFGYHDALLQAFTAFQRATPESILRAYLAGELHTRLTIPVSLMIRWGVDVPKIFVDDLEWFTGLLRRSVFKRIQAPPIIVTSTGAFGYDFREALIAPRPSPAYCILRGEVLRLERYPAQP